MSLYLLNVTAHLFAAFLWLGGMFFLAVVGAPALRRLEPAALRARVFGEIGVRFRRVGWIAIAVLVFTGLVNLHFRGVLSWNVLGDGAFWTTTSYGRALAWKLGAVTAMIVVSALHDFVFGPAASRLGPGGPEAVRARRRAVHLARLNGGLGIVVVIVAVRLARGG